VWLLTHLHTSTARRSRLQIKVTKCSSCTVGQCLLEFEECREFPSSLFVLCLSSSSSWNEGIVWLTLVAVAALLLLSVVQFYIPKLKLLIRVGALRAFRVLTTTHPFLFTLWLCVGAARPCAVWFFVAHPPFRVCCAPACAVRSGDLHTWCCAAGAHRGLREDACSGTREHHYHWHNLPAAPASFTATRLPGIVTHLLCAIQSSTSQPLRGGVVTHRLPRHYFQECPYTASTLPRWPVREPSETQPPCSSCASNEKRAPPTPHSTESSVYTNNGLH
jgi:hypothetical protein